MANTEMTIKAVVELDDESKQLLRELRDRLRPIPAAEQLPPGIAAMVPEHFAATALRDAQRQALLAVLEALDGWIEVAQHNHDALEHGGLENIGEECWRQFSPGDIRNMINSAAHKLGVDKFPYPAHPKEDSK